jgi:two-component system, chemotaxis family, chemotaxis protein CheY
MNDKYKILVIDDSRTMYTLISNFLKAEGFKDIDHANNGKEGIEMIKKKSYDLITTDVDMPVMDGLEAAREILKFNSKMKILILSARQGDDYLNAANELNVNYLCKPFTAKKLFESVNKILNQD